MHQQPQPRYVPHPQPYGAPQPPYSQPPQSWPPQYGTGQYGPPQWGPPLGPPRDPRPWHQQHRKLLVWTGVLSGLAVIGGIGSATGATKPASDTSAAAASSAAPVRAGAVKPHKAPAKQAAPTCLAQGRAWVNNGADTQMGAIEADLTAFGGAATTFAGDINTGTAGSSDVAGVQLAAADMESDAQALEADPAPSCIPGLRADLAAGTGDFSKCAIGAENAMDQYTAGDMDAAAADINAADAKLTAGTGKIGDATAALKNFENS